MSDHLAPLLESAFPAYPASNTLSRRVDRVARKIATKRRGRRALGIFAILGGVCLAWCIPACVRTYTALAQMRPYPDSVLIRTDTYLGEEVIRRTWSKGDSYRTIADGSKEKTIRNGLGITTFPQQQSTLSRGDGIYTYYPELKLVVRRNRSTSGQNTRTVRLTPLLMVVGSLLSGTRVEQGTYFGQRVNRIVNVYNDRDRFDMITDADTGLSIGASRMQLVNGRWEESSRDRIIVEDSVKGDELFDPRTVGAGPIVELDSLKHRYISEATRSNLGQATLGNGVNLALNKVEVTKDGAVFIAYNGPLVEESHRGTSSIYASDNANHEYFLGTDYTFAGEGACVDPVDQRLSLRFAVLLPTGMYAPKWPLKLTFKVRTRGDGRLSRPEWEPGSQFNMWGRSTFSKADKELIWGQARVDAPLSGDSPSFRALTDERSSWATQDMIYRAKETNAFATENWPALESIELAMLADPVYGIAFSKWERYNNLVASALGRNDEAKAKQYRALRDAQADRPEENANWFERAFSRATTVPRAF